MSAAELAAVKKAKVSVILPVKGIHGQTMENWRSQVGSSHGGGIEYIFTMESKEDPAYNAALQLAEEVPSSEIKVINAGLSFYCAQKIHNLLEGVAVMRADSDFVLFLDDDAEMTPTALQVLIATLLKSHDVMVASGWPHDFVSNADQLRPPQFAMKGYRLLSYSAIHSDHASPGLWGGCCLLRRKDLMDPEIGILEGWQNHGYSDDMIIGGRCHQAGKRIVVPMPAMLPARISGQYSWTQHWNYKRRQMFVCATYSNHADFLQNHMILIFPSLLGSFFACFSFALLSLLSVVGVLWSAAAGQLTASLWARDAQCGALPVSAEGVMLAVLAECAVWTACMNLSYESVGRVCGAMIGREERVVSAHSRAQAWALTVFGFIAESVIMVTTSVVALLHHRIVWSGVTYVKLRGKVSEVWRTDSSGTPYTVPRQQSAQEALERRRQRLQR